ncbi:heat shock factor (HSF)-type transcription factor [Rhodotorula toruloides]|uniref:Heat shock factor (HSF)-type transcription factor n=1 Tax=Rhodotorula toruloides TaxID=5286 RepID=A0A511KNT7_RHOTO|nr:heat shock factor (HSF)-type transcription factor [Rhodotorula toruloides]
MAANRSPPLANFSQPSRYPPIPSVPGHPPTYQPYQMSPSMNPYGLPHASAPSHHPYQHAFPTHPHPVAYTPYTPYMHAPQHHLPHGHHYGSQMSFNHLSAPLDPNAILPLPGGPSPRPPASDALALPTPPAAFQTLPNPPASAAPALPVPPPIQNEVPFGLPTPPAHLEKGAENANAVASPSKSTVTTSAAAAAPTPAVAPAPAARTPKPAERPPPRRASIAAAANLPAHESTSPQPLRARLRAPALPAPAPVIAPDPVPAHKPHRRKGQPGRRPKNGKSGDAGAAKRRASRGGWGTGGGNRPETLLQNDPEDVSEYVRWDKSGRLIIIPDEKVLVEKVCKVHFAQKNITSFNKQMNNWDFKRHSRSQRDISVIAKAEPGVTRQTRIWYHTTLRSDSSWDDVNAVGRHEDGLAKKRRVKSKTTGIIEEGPGIGRTKRKKGTPPSIGKRSDDEGDDEKPSRSQSPETVDGPSSSVGKRAAALRKTMPSKKRRKMYDSSDESDDFSDSSEGSEDESGSGEGASDSLDDLSDSEEESEKAIVKGKGKAKAQADDGENEEDEDAEGEPDEEIIEQQKAAAASVANGKSKTKAATRIQDTPVKGKARAASSAPFGSKPPPTKRARTDNQSTAPAPTTKRAAAAAAAKAAAAKAEEEEEEKEEARKEEEERAANLADEDARTIAAAKPAKPGEPAKSAGGRRTTRRSLTAAAGANEESEQAQDPGAHKEVGKESEEAAADLEQKGAMRDSKKQDEEMNEATENETDGASAAKPADAAEPMQVDEQAVNADDAANADGDADADSESDEDADALKSIATAGTRRTRSSRGPGQASPAATLAASATVAKKPSAAQKFSRPVRDRTSTGRTTRQQQQPGVPEPAAEGDPAPAKNTRAGRRSLAKDQDVAKGDRTTASTAQAAPGRGEKGKTPAVNARKAPAVPLVAGAAAAPAASTSTSGTTGRKLKGRGGGWYTSPQDEVQSHDMRRGGAGYRAGSASMDGASADGSSASGSSNGDPPMMLSLNPQTGGRPRDGYSLPRPPHLVDGARYSSMLATGVSAFSPTPSTSAGMARSPSVASMQVYYPDSSNPYGSSPYPSYPHQQQAPVASHRHPIRRHVAPYFSEPGRARPAYHYHGAEPIARPYVNPVHQVTDEMLEDGDEADVYGAEFAATAVGPSNSFAAPASMDGYGDEQGFGYYQQVAVAPAKSRNSWADASDSASMFSLVPGGYKRPDGRLSNLRRSPKGEGEDAEMQEDGGREGSWPRTMTRGASELFPEIHQQQRDDRYASDF